MTFGSSTLFGVNTYGVPTTGLMAEVPQAPVLSIVAAPGGPSPVAAGMAMMGLATGALGHVADLGVFGSGLTLPTVGGPEWQFRTAREAWLAIAALIFGKSLQIEIAPRNAMFSIHQFLTGGVLRMVALKQFRDVENGRFACYQAVTESPAELTGFTGATILSDPLALHVENLVGQPLMADFGWTSNNIPVEAAFQTQFQFKVGLGKEVWRA
jgi:hypothetical protein